MDPYYIQPGTPVYFGIITLHGTARRTLHGFVQSDNGAYVTVIVPSMNNKTFVATHSALTYDDTPKQSPPLSYLPQRSLLTILSLKVGAPHDT